LIQIIPFFANKEPVFLPLLARGLSDLSALRFNMVEIQAQVNTDLEFDRKDQRLDQLVSDITWEGQDLWFLGELNGEGNLSMALVLYEPTSDQIVYRDSFEAPEDKFLTEWEIHLQDLMKYLDQEIEVLTVPRRMYTKSLEAFLAFRSGLETLSQAKDDRTRDEGLESLLKAVAYDPEFVEAADILLLFLIQNDVSRNFDQSVNILERLRQIASNHPRIPLVLAEVYYQWGNKEKTEQLLQELVAAFPQFTEGWIRLALFYHASDRLPEALATLESILAFEPDEPTALDLMGAIYAGQGERIRAEEVWLKVREIDPERVNILNNLALLAEENEDLEKAENYHQQATDLNSNWWGSYYHYGSFCRRRERLEEAAIWLAKAVELNPTHSQSYQNLGLTQIQLGRYSEAQESLLQLLRLAPDNVTRRQTLQLLGQFDDPEIKVEFKIRRLERFWEAGKRWLVIGRLLFIFNQARDHWYYWYLIGRIGEELGFKSIAIFSWRIGLKYDPGFPLLKKTGLYYLGKGSLKKALAVLRKAFQLHKSDPETSRAYLQTLVNLGEVEELQANMKGLTQLNMPNINQTSIHI
jgi:tetratricopeptide (TPR) repeat protein